MVQQHLAVALLVALVVDLAVSTETALPEVEEAEEPVVLLLHMEVVEASPLIGQAALPQTQEAQRIQ